MPITITGKLNYSDQAHVSGNTGIIFSHDRCILVGLDSNPYFGFKSAKIIKEPSIMIDDEASMNQAIQKLIDFKRMIKIALFGNLSLSSDNIISFFSINGADDIDKLIHHITAKVCFSSAQPGISALTERTRDGSNWSLKWTFS